MELVAVNQCAGNSRGFFEPRVPGGQLGNGAMGNARWKGVPLKAVLDKAGVQAGAVQVSFRGLDQPVLPETPAFVKALDLDHALDGEVMVAYAMNGEDLPWLNGFPLRLVVPGCYGTYWLKHLTRITVLDAPLDNFWMKTAYRIPDNACACVEPGKRPTRRPDRPVRRPLVPDQHRRRSDRGGEHGHCPARRRVRRRLRNYRCRRLGRRRRDMDRRRARRGLGKYSFREWKARVTLPPGRHQLKVRATNRIGQSQPLEPLWNPGGYMRNVVEDDERDGGVRRATMNRLVFLVSLVALSPAAIATRSPISCRRRPPCSSRAPASRPRLSAAPAIPRITSAPSHKKGKAFWEAEVQKMIKLYKAPIDPRTSRRSWTISPRRIEEPPSPAARRATRRSRGPPPRSAAGGDQKAFRFS